MNGLYGYRINLNMHANHLSDILVILKRALKNFNKFGRKIPPLFIVMSNEQITVLLVSFTRILTILKKKYYLGTKCIVMYTPGSSPGTG